MTTSTTLVRRLDAIAITSETFRPFGQLIVPQPDDVAFNAKDAQLQLDNGTPRFYIMSLHQRGRRFHTITRHSGCTQCLGSLEGRTWFLGGAPPSTSPQPNPVNFYNLEQSDTNVVDHTTCDLLQTYGLTFEIV